MLQEFSPSRRDIADYRSLLSEEVFDELEILAAPLADKKILHINATPKGGGVAEILASLVPLEVSLGIDAKWYFIDVDGEFYEATKILHNSLQGGNVTLTSEQEELYLHINKCIAEEINAMRPDLVIIHDPQPLAVGSFLRNVPMILRIHPDLSNPNPSTVDFLQPFLACYRRVVFTLKEYELGVIPQDKIRIIAPAIDPLAEKNIAMPQERVKEILTCSGIDTSKQLMTQISRFDPWKDPQGVLDAFFIVQEEIPDIQLALVGIIEAQDDPEQFRVYKEICDRACDTENVFLFSDPKQLGKYSMADFINAFQTGSDVILQKSLKEGFGLTVTEAMLKSRPVVGGNVGGIALQIQNEENGFLVDSASDAAARTIEILRDKALAEKIGRSARETVIEKYLLTRLLRDHLRLMNEVIP